MNLFKFLLIALLALLSAHFFPLAAQNEWSGEWQVTIRHAEFGEMRTRLRFRFSDAENFTARSHPDGVKNLVGGLKATTAKWFSKKPMLRTGALCRIEGGRASGPQISGALDLPMGARMTFRGGGGGGKWRAELLNTKGKSVGGLEGVRVEPDSKTDDYPALITSLLNTYEEKIYDRRALQTPEWRAFARKMSAAGRKAKDDLDIVAAFYTGVEKLPFTHCYLFRTEDPGAGTSQMKARFEPRPGQVSLAEKTPETAVLRIQSFYCPARDVDSVMQIVLAKNYSNLVVDIRGNSGGSLEGGMTLAKYLTREETPTGVYLTQKWFNEHPAPPTAAELASMPAFTQADVLAFTQELEESGFVVLKARPGAQHFGGRVFLLTDRRSASACEPLAWNLKHSGRVTVVGEPTAGAMLSAEGYPLRSNFTAVIPNGDYYTPTGERLDRVGVPPHIEVASAAALEHVLRLIEMDKTH
jgi:carboxyl-terminal processing protease